MKIYDLSQGKYDVTVDVGASYTTQRQMASESMMELIQYAPQLAPRILDLIAKNLDWPGADDIAARLKENPITPEQVQQAADQAVQQALSDKKYELEHFKLETDRIAKFAKIETEDDKIEIELLKVLNDAEATDRESRARAIELLNQMKENQPIMGEQTSSQENLQ